jgi:hypothetical protein
MLNRWEEMHRAVLGGLPVSRDLSSRHPLSLVRVGDIQLTKVYLIRLPCVQAAELLTPLSSSSCRAL